MIYLFDKKQTLTGVIDEHTEALSATLEMKINEASTLDFSLPLDDDLSEKMAGVKYVGVPSPNSADKIVFLRLMTINDETDCVEYMAKELAYQELSSKGYIEDKRPVESDAQTLMNIALDGSGYKLGVVNVAGQVKTNFYYMDHLSAISNVVELLGGEIYFYVSIKGSKITGRYMDYVAEQGTNTSKTFADGSNLITVERKRDMSSVYTAILPRGKGEQVSSGENDTPDGYGRRINIAGITWSKAKGNPLDKKSGNKILVDPDATVEYGNADGTPRLLLKTYDDIEDANVLIKKAYMDLMTMNKPAVQYSATVANVGDMQLGDTIVIMHSKRSMSYRTRVFHITYDLIDNTKTVAEFGNDLSKDSITSQINSISSNGATISDQVQWNVSNGGHNNTSYGAREPANPRKGDVWFKQLPNGNTEEYYFDGTLWVLGSQTDQQWKENIAVAQGANTTFYGTSTPVGAVTGDVWFKNDNNEPDGKAMYTYSGSVWVKFKGAYDANRLTSGEINGKILQITNVDTTNLVGDIDGKLNNIKNVDTSSLIGGLDGTRNPLSNVPANQLTGTMNKEVVNTINLNAEQITSGKLNANIVGAIELNAGQITSGQLDSNIVNAMELNARQITSGELNSNIVNAIRLNASQITTGELNANIVSAMKLDARQIIAGQIDASIINVFNLNADNIKTGKIDASKINVMNISASNIVTGTLSANFLKGGQIDASQVNVINMNANNIVTGSIRGANLDINLNTGQVEFRNGRIHSTSGSIDVNINQGYLSVANRQNNVLIKDGEIAFTHPDLFSPSTDPYLRITNSIVNGSFSFGTIQAKNGLELNSKGNESTVIGSVIGIQNLSGIKFGKNDEGQLEETLVGGADKGVIISGGTGFGTMNTSPYIRVGSNASGTGIGNHVVINGKFFFSKPTYDKTSSGGANVHVNDDGALVRSTSARKYKTNIKHDVSIDDSRRLLNIPLSTWDDIAEIKNTGSSNRYFGMIAEDLADAGLDYLVTRGKDNQIEGIEYSRVALLLIPIVKQMQDEIKSLRDNIISQEHDVNNK